MPKNESINSRVTNGLIGALLEQEAKHRKNAEMVTDTFMGIGLEPPSSAMVNNMIADEIHKIIQSYYCFKIRKVK